VILINIAPTLLSGGQTGIQRVCRELQRHADAVRQGCGMALEFGALVAGRWLPADRVPAADTPVALQGPRRRGRLARWPTWLALPLIDALQARARQHHRQQLAQQATALLGLSRAIQPHEPVVDIDAGWIVESGDTPGPRLTLIYDLIPLEHPDCVAWDERWRFRRWFGRACQRSQGLLVTSQAVAESIRQQRGHRRVPPIECFALGANPRIVPGPVRSAMPLPAPPFFLSVGTLEPRKNPLLALEAFRRYRQGGGRAEYVWLGRPGWHALRLARAFEQARADGLPVHWLSNADDGLLALAYAQCEAVLMPSRAEGFGLPLVEAAAHGKPVLASDLAVFREVAPAGTRFLPASDPAAWSAAMAALASHPGPLAIQAPLSWEASARQFGRALAALLSAAGA
jgi:alpha-1,2-rhamnosyltransferase